MKGQFIDYSQYGLLHRTSNLMKSVEREIDRFKRSQLYSLGEQIISCAGHANKKIEEAYSHNGKEQAIDFYQAQASIDAFIAYMNLAKSLRYGDYTDIIREAKEVSELLDIDALRALETQAKKN